MSQLKKLENAMLKGVELERDRCMRICHKVIQITARGLNQKLMTSTEKHIAQTKLAMAEAFIGAVQMKIMSGVDPDAEETPREGPGFDPDAVGDPRGDEDGGRAG